jgi:hypothetical protein
MTVGDEDAVSVVNEDAEDLFVATITEEVSGYLDP